MKNDLFLLCDRVRECSFALHRHLRHGHVEKIYENGLAHRLRKQTLAVIQQQPLKVSDEDSTVERKTCRALADEHVAQVLGYLRASRIAHGLLINFGSPKLETRKYALSDAS